MESLVKGGKCEGAGGEEPGEAPGNITDVSDDDDGFIAKLAGKFSAESVTGSSFSVSLFTSSSWTLWGSNTSEPESKMGGVSLGNRSCRNLGRN